VPDMKPDRVGRDSAGMESSGHPSSDLDNISHSTTYAFRLLANLNELLTNTNNNLCDVEIVAGKESNGSMAEKSKIRYAHRTVLAAASPYFNAMFTSDFVEAVDAKRQQIVIQGLTVQTLDSLLHFIYSGRIDINQDNVQDLLIAGDMIELAEVVEMATSFLVDQLDPSNAIGIYRFAYDHNCLMLKDSCLNYIWENFVSVSQEEEFGDLPKEMICSEDMLGSEMLKVDSEYQVFTAAMGWVQSDITSRRRFIFDVLKYIRLKLVPPKRLDSFSKECRDVSLKVALNSVQKDVTLSKGSLVSLHAQPRQAAKKNIYIIGGSQREFNESAWTRSEYIYDTVEMFDIYNSRWQQVTPMNSGRILPGIAVLNGKVYVCGGEEDTLILANGEVYDPQEDVWTEMNASMSTPRCEFGMCAHDGFLYAFGGWVGEDIGGSIERYDTITDRWSVVGKMEEPRFSMGTVAYDGLIYLVGGCTHTRRHMQELVSYNPATGEWRTHASMLVPRSQMGCLVHDGCLYVMGGTNRNNEVLSSVERYNFKTGGWCVLPPMLEPRASPSVASVNSKIYVFGGDQINEVNFYRARNTVAFVEVFDPLTNSWTQSINMPDSRSEAGAVVI